MTRFRALAVLFICLLAPAARAQAQAPAPTPFPDGMRESVITDPGTGLPVQLVTGGKPGAPWVVLVHGLGQQASRDWIPVLPPLLERYQVLLVDLPGFGRSGRPDGVLSPKRYADFVQWVITRHTRRPVFVVGHSLGAAVALRHSHTYPQQVTRLLLIDAAGLLQTTVFARHLAKVPDAIPGRVAGMRVMPGLVRRVSSVLNHVSGQFQDLTASNANTLTMLAGSELARRYLYKESGNINAALGLVNDNFSALLGDVGVPVAMLWGEHDPVAPLRTGIALRALLPMATLEVLPGVGHVPMSQATDQTAAWLLATLRGAQPGPPEGRAGASQGDAVCKDQQNLVYTGRWRTLRLEHCANIRIENASIERLVATRSTVALTDVTIASGGTALELKDTNLAATGLRISAARVWQLDNSRLDLAAARLRAPELGADKGGSLLFMSLSRWCDGAGDWYLHDTWKPDAGKLDQQFQRAPGARCALGEIGADQVDAVGAKAVDAP
ncbi:MAG: alpha/beta hydrolase [Pseudomonadota bacterium]